MLGFIKRLTMTSLIMIAAGCALTSEPGHEYAVEITEVEPLAGNPSGYCVYRITCEDPEIPRLYFVAKCSKYVIGEKIMIQMNDMD